jgi:hypothetical protein
MPEVDKKKMLGFYVLKNGYFAKVLENTVEIMDPHTNTTKSVTFPLSSCITQIVRIAELKNQCIVILCAYEKEDAITVLWIVNVVNTELSVCQVVSSSVYDFSILFDDSILTLDFGSSKTWEYTNGKLELKNLLENPQFVRYAPIVLPNTQKMLGETISYARNTSLYDFATKETKKLDLGPRYRDAIDVISFQDKNFILLTQEINTDKKLIYACLKICDQHLKVLTGFDLEGLWNGGEHISYNKIYLLQDNHLLVVNDTAFSTQQTIQIFKIKANRFYKVFSKTLEPDTLTAVNAWGEMYTCNKSGEVVLHYFSHQTDKFAHAIEATIPIPNLVNIVTDYCGLFRSKSNREQNIYFSEENHHINNNSNCVIL